ncbi:unnamed protein product [Acanthoscelides obtectus]|uniref:Uncharacterized protein n=1 Tax=Acanthoscelides obtectus TaxID=200917 RepID=A0A9P0Q616_ACAOB|nr:unnamed protein product [Acanthoscelides obtectus]CAK1625361.1 hypothetical protein AOBTE_LOCUS3125 [Acanthoscelides obtectus]
MCLLIYELPASKSSEWKRASTKVIFAGVAFVVDAFSDPALEPAVGDVGAVLKLGGFGLSSGGVC